MPLPFLLAGAAIFAGIKGIIDGGKAISNNNKAKELIESAKNIYEKAQNALEAQRITTSKDLELLGIEKVNSWSDDIGHFTYCFKKFKKVDLRGNLNLNNKLNLQIDNTNNFKGMEIASMKAAEVVKAGISTLGAGALAGIASYGGAMMFASASTGTAIASLSGVAATNATLAWFGGGSLAAGGLGMAGGTAILGGIVAGPVLAVAGAIMAAKSEENFSKAQKTYSEAELAVEKMRTMVDFMIKVSDISNDYRAFIKCFSARFKPVLTELQNIYESALEVQKKYFINRLRKLFGMEIYINYRKLNISQQKTLQLSWLMAQVLYAVLAAPLISKSGSIEPNAYSTLGEAKQALQELSE